MERSQKRVCRAESFTDSNQQPSKGERGGFLIDFQVTKFFSSSDFKFCLFQIFNQIHKGE